MSEERNDDYLWDRSGEPDPEVQRLESLLAPFGHDGRAFAGETRRSGRNVWRFVSYAVAAAAVIFAAVLVFWDGTQLRLINTADGNALHQGARIVTTTQGTVLELEDGLSKITLAPGSELWIDQLRRDRTHLNLRRGKLEAFVSADAKERFFQVQTPATNCVDLGCMYTLTVDDEQNADVVVELGRVAFEDGGREVVVPAGATCRATKKAGAGTPRHEDTPRLVVRFLDDFDARRGPEQAAERLRLARRILALLAGDESRKYSLIPWHLLQDPSPKVAAAAGAWLVEHCPKDVPQGFSAADPITAPDRNAWRGKLEEFWGW